ncbi:hypothetical protein MN116_003169 [Schistosoma mekongi]|uniref:Uncharacterized protein n=1 Tax=Schistosoma mekongi TaxID=38744 RepID=A0AAE1ZH16_SCHME|nr:hypothetical protein MN116_003169 [Schistosoma mekongi]
MHRSYSLDENDDFKRTIFVNDYNHDEEKGIILPCMFPDDSSIPNVDKCDKTENFLHILDALKSAVANYEGYTEAENNFMNDIKDLCNKAKSLEEKLKNKKCLIISHFQNVVSNLTDGN